jgi:hypothetical protein
MRSRYFVIFAGLVLLASTSAGAQGVITVQNVEGLYDAVNNPAHAGAEVRVKGGRKYRLTFQKRLANGSTITRPNEGRLVLQPGMSLVGDNDYVLQDGRPIVRGGGSEVYAAPATETIIDGSDLLGGPEEAFGTAAIVSMGNGNSVSRVTIRSNQDSKAAIAVEIIGRGGMAAEVVGCTLEGGASGGRRGVMILHLPGSENTSLNVNLKNNIIRHHRAIFGFGVQALRAQTSGVEVSVDLTNSVIYDNFLGLLLANIVATGTTTSVSSDHNLYRGNDEGILILGGRDFGAEVGSLGNVTRIVSTDDTIIENDRYAIRTIAGLRDDDLAPENSDNLVSIDFQGTQFISPTGPQNGELGDGRLDLIIEGAVTFVPDLSAGVNNVAELKLRNLAAPPMAGESVVVYTLDADVPEPTNRVTFVGGEKKLAGYNPKVPIVVFH